MPFSSRLYTDTRAHSDPRTPPNATTMTVEYSPHSDGPMDSEGGTADLNGKPPVLVTTHASVHSYEQCTFHVVMSDHFLIPRL